MRTRLRKKSSDRNSASTKAEQDQLQVRSFGDSSQSNEEVSSASSEKSIGYNFSQIEVQPATPRVIQPQLSIGRTNNKYEQEADLVANHVVKRIHPSVQPSTKLLPIQRMENPVIQRQPPYDGNDKPTGLVMKDYMKTKCQFSPKKIVYIARDFLNAYKTNDWNNPKVVAAGIEGLGQIFALTHKKIKNPYVKVGLEAGHLASKVVAEEIRNSAQPPHEVNYFKGKTSMSSINLPEKESHFINMKELFTMIENNMKNSPERIEYSEIIEKIEGKNIAEEIEPALSFEYPWLKKFLDINETD